MTDGSLVQDPEAVSDQDLVRAHVEGDPEAFGTLVRRHRDRLWAVALRTTGDPEEAADSLQDALISAYRRAASFRGDAAVTTWLHRVVVNACLDRRRRNAVRASEPLPEDVETRARSGPGAADLRADRRSADPVEGVLDAERRAVVHAALRALPEEQRVALVLVDLEQWSVAEAATALSIPVGTVKSRCHRGRARLATLLADLDPALGRSPGSGTDPTGAASDLPDDAHTRTTTRARQGGEHP